MLAGIKPEQDKYMLVDVDTGAVDAVGNPITRKLPFNTRTEQIVSVGGSAGQGGAAVDGYPEGTELKGADGMLYVVKNGVPVRK